MQFSFGNTVMGPGIAITSDGVTLFVSEHGAHKVRKVATADGTTTSSTRTSSSTSQTDLCYLSTKFIPHQFLLNAINECIYFEY